MSDNGSAANKLNQQLFMQRKIKPKILIRYGIILGLAFFGLKILVNFLAIKAAEGVSHFFMSVLGPILYRLNNT